MNYEPRFKKKDKVISINYVYDSFYRGSLIEINENNKDKYLYYKTIYIKVNMLITSNSYNFPYK